MAKLFWMLGCLIFALMNNVKPFMSNSIPFDFTGYYTSTLGVDDPAAIYASFFSADGELYQPCNPSVIEVPKVYLGDKSVQSITEGDIFSYFIPLSASTSEVEINTPIAEGTLVPLVAPMAGVIITDPDASYWSSFMEFKCSFGVKTYTITFEDMECWYCCVGHTKTTSGNYRHQYVEAEDFANTIKQGQFLGLANSNTKITIQDESGKVLTFAEFFGVDDTSSALKYKGINPPLDASYVPPQTTEG